MSTIPHSNKISHPSNPLNGVLTWSLASCLMEIPPAPRMEESLRLEERASRCALAPRRTGGMSAISLLNLVTLLTTTYCSNLCALHWLKQIKMNGSTEQFYVYYGDLTVDQRKVRYVISGFRVYIDIYAILVRAMTKRRLNQQVVYWR